MLVSLLRWSSVLLFLLGLLGRREFSTAGPTTFRPTVAARGSLSLQILLQARCYNGERLDLGSGPRNRSSPSLLRTFEGLTASSSADPTCRPPIDVIEPYGGRRVSVSTFPVVTSRGEGSDTCSSSTRAI